jgi:uncharacterized membrane protein YoaK (UPF0700 family)
VITLSRDGAIGALLAFTAGFVDTAGFVALFGLFTAHVTGNFVLIGATLAAGGLGILAKLLALPTFVVAVALARAFVLRCERRGAGAARPLLAAQAFLLALFLAVGLAAAPVLNADAPLAVLAGIAGVAAMGVQNAASRTVFATLSPTTVMTGNVTQVVMDVVDLASSRAEPATRARLTKMWPPVAAFALGAVGGAVGFASAGFWCLLVPIVFVLLTLAASSEKRVVAGDA